VVSSLSGRKVFTLRFKRLRKGRDGRRGGGKHRLSEESTPVLRKSAVSCSGATKVQKKTELRAGANSKREGGFRRRRGGRKAPVSCCRRKGALICSVEGQGGARGKDHSVCVEKRGAPRRVGRGATSSPERGWSRVRHRGEQRKAFMAQKGGEATGRRKRKDPPHHLRGCFSMTSRCGGEKRERLSIRRDRRREGRWASSEKQTRTALGDCLQRKLFTERSHKDQRWRLLTF